MKNIIVVLLVFVANSSFAQRQPKFDSVALLLFNKGLDFADNGQDDSALNTWMKVVNRKNTPHNNVYGNAYFNVASMYWKMGKNDKAKEWYENIMNSSMRDDEPSLDLSEPHANYKHKSAVALANLAAMSGDFKLALQWINKADTVYPYFGIEGSLSSCAEEEAAIVSEKTDILLRLKQKDEAIYIMLSQLLYSGNLENSFEGLNDKLLQVVSQPGFKKDLEAALNNATFETIAKGKWLASFTLYGRSYNIPIHKMEASQAIRIYRPVFYVGGGETIDKAFFLEYVRNRGFYKMLK